MQINTDKMPSHWSEWLLIKSTSNDTGRRKKGALFITSETKLTAAMETVLEIPSKKTENRICTIWPDVPWTCTLKQSERDTMHPNISNAAAVYN